MFYRIKTIAWETFEDFFRARSPTRGAAISFYAVTSFVPVLVIAIAIAGYFFGDEAARERIVAELRGLLGSEGAILVEGAIESGYELSTGTFAAIVSIAGFMLISSGVFLELRRGLNDIWNVEPRNGTLPRLMRERAASFGLVVALGFMLLISLVADAVINAFTDIINVNLAIGAALLRIVNSGVSFLIVAGLFAAIYRILPARKLEWRDVALGAVLTAALFEVGKLAIGSYLGSRAVGSSYGAAGALIALLFWVYYSVQIFLFGASLAHVLARRNGKTD